MEDVVLLNQQPSRYQLTSEAALEFCTNLRQERQFHIDF